MRTLDPARSVWSKEIGPSACQAEARLEASAGVEVLGVIDSMEAAASVIVTPGAEQTSPPRA
jgi:hypothetical protein